SRRGARAPPPGGGAPRGGDSVLRRVRLPEVAANHFGHLDVVGKEALVDGGNLRELGGGNEWCRRRLRRARGGGAGNGERERERAPVPARERHAATIRHLGIQIFRLKAEAT